MNIHTFLVAMTNELLPVYHDVSLARFNALLLLEKATGMSKVQLLAGASDPLSLETQKQVTTWVNEITHDHKPLQYILGTVPFGPVEIYVEPPILIPRPETEEWAISLAHQLEKIQTAAPLKILDLCTGSGCIGLLFAHMLPHAQIYASDSNPAALALAQKNAAHNAVTNITFMLSDLFDAFSKDMSFDLIITNPPYIDEKEWRTLEPTVRDWEDKGALVASNRGLGLIEKIINRAPAFIHHNPLLAHHHIPQLSIEIGHNQAKDVKVLMKTYRYHDILVQKDLAGKDRVITGRLEHGAHTASRS